MFAPRSHREYRAGLLASGRGRAGRGEGTGTDHVFKGGSEPQPSRERVDGRADEQTPARRVGALLELKGGTHRLGLVHTASIAGGAAARVAGATVVFPGRPGGAAVPGAAERSAAGSWPRELMDSFW